MEKIWVPDRNAAALRLAGAVAEKGVHWQTKALPSRNFAEGHEGLEVCCDFRLTRNETCGEHAVLLPIVAIKNRDAAALQLP